MGGSKGGDSPAPDYTQVSAANEKAAELSAQTSREQLAWAKERYAADSKVTQQFLDVALPAMKAESEAGAENRQRYKTVFQPLEDDLIKEAKDYASPQRAEMEAGRAQGDVAQAFEGQRRSALATLEGFGVDPSTARAGALDRTVRVAEAAVSAGAANAARTNTENIGRALRGEAINIGKGYPGNVAQAYQTATNSGSGAISNNLATTASGANTMGTGVQWSQQQGNFLGNWGNNIGGQAQAYAADQQAAAQGQAGIGSMVGSIAGIAAMAMMSDKGTKTDVNPVGKASIGGGAAYSDRRMKKDIHKVGVTTKESNSLTLYTFRYKDDPQKQLRLGVMAQEVKKKNPSAVIDMANGLMAVDYGKVFKTPEKKRA